MTAPQPPDRPVTYHEASRSDRTWLQARDRWEELDGRHHLARAIAALKARGEYDPAKHGTKDYAPLTLAEHLEVLASGEVVARVYRHPYLIHWALEAGATWQQVAEATGTSESKARQEYRDLAEGQHRLWRDTDHRFGMDDAEYAAALERAGAGQAVGGDEDQAAVILAALNEAAGLIRRQAALCLVCETHPASLCEEHGEALRRAESYSALAARLTGGAK